MACLERLIESIHRPELSDEVLEQLTRLGDPAMVRYIDGFLAPPTLIGSKTHSGVETADSGQKQRGTEGKEVKEGQEGQEGEEGQEGQEKKIKMKGSWWVLLGAWVLGEATRESRTRAAAKVSTIGNKA
jgi:hypothetical protein